MNRDEARIVLDMHAAGQDVPCEAVAAARCVLAVRPTLVAVALAELTALEIELGIAPMMTVDEAPGDEIGGGA